MAVAKRNKLGVVFGGIKRLTKYEIGIIVTVLALLLSYFAFPVYWLLDRKQEKIALCNMASTITTDPEEIRNLDDHDPWVSALYPDCIEPPRWTRLYDWMMNSDHPEAYYRHARVVGLMLNDARTTDESLKYLHNMPYLLYINVRGSKITDAGVLLISKHGNITDVNIDNTAVTDAALKDLLNMKSLVCVHIKNTGISKKAVLEFHYAVPNVQIDSDFNGKCDGELF